MAHSSSLDKHQEPAGIAIAKVVALLCVFALVLLGLVMVYSSSSIKAISEGKDAMYFLGNQALYAVVGAGVAFLLWKVVPLDVWRGPLLWVFLGIAIVLLLVTAFVGSEVNGAKRWLNIGISIQPSEFAKVIFILAAARIISDLRTGNLSVNRALIYALFIAVPLFGLVLKAESDLGSTAICMVGILAAMWFGGVSKRTFLVILGLVVIFVAISILFSSYRSSRFVYLDPFNDGQGGYGDGYQIIRSLYALSEGGVFGVGLGNSHEKYLYLFASESDFIFAIIGEELGITGAMFVIVLFVALCISGLYIALHAASYFGTVVAGSFSVALIFQAFLNIGSTVAILPTTGKPLPFVSLGGSSMIASFMMIGLVLAVAKEAGAYDIYGARRSNLRVVRAVDSNLTGRQGA